MVSFLTVLLLTGMTLLTPSMSQEIQVRGQRSPTDTKDSVKVVISESWTSQSQSSDSQGKELDLVPGFPLVLTHQIKLVPSVGCGCEVEVATLRERLRELEREVSVLREKCGGAEGDCCTAKESKGAGSSVKEQTGDCPNKCSDQGRCVDGRCVCFPGFIGPDCKDSNCPGNCNDRGRCVSGQCECDPGFSGPDCSQTGCPGSCNHHGRCVDGKCVCDAGFTGPGCLDESCPGNCNNRGRCVNGRCECDPGFKGPDCSKISCPNNCTNRGRCVNGRCECDPGFKGPDCSKISCPSNCTNRGRCVNGRCECDPGFKGPDCSKNSCPSNCTNRGRCVNGRCECDPGFKGPDCSKNSCPSNCTNRGRCVNGRCECDPGFKGPDCSKNSCPSNCNKRGRCVNGRCECDPGFKGPDCSKISCPSNCNNRGRCVNGLCVCNPGFKGPDCSKISCPNNCSKRGRCVNGQCECDPGFTGPDCSKNNCPGNCNNRGRCVDGRCDCEPGFTGLDCSEISCPSNCNNRGRCVNGQCECDPRFTGPDCSEISCPSNCNNRGRCVNGQCDCDPRFTGPDCSEISCPGNCNNRGRCVDGQCDCDSGYTGPDCSKNTCPGNCNNRGRCMDGRCECDPRFTGPDCSEISCPSNCNNRGRCVNGQCECDPRFTGPDCSENSCPNNCNNRGRCVNGQCECDPRFTGLDCSEISCPSNCNNRGRCVNGQCECDPRFTGPDCSEISCPSNCNNRGRCVNGQCECDPRFTGPDCSEISCPGNCNNRGRCVDGRCKCDPGFTGPDCSEISCPSNCNNRGRCVNGQCECDPRFTGPDCSEISCPSNCNNRGRCVNGQCECDPRFMGSDCSENSCPNNCKNRGRCVDGRCECDPGFMGPDCSEISCPSNCNNRGRCVNGRCECDPRFTGPDCSENSCPSNCNNRGRCVDGQCECDLGFRGSDCSESSCPDNCNSRGRCLDGKCICDSGFTGATCSDESCSGNCNSRGRCVNGQCICDVGFSGPDCSEKDCPSNCSNRGTCVKGKCVCNVGFAGPKCAVKACLNNCNHKGRCIKGKCVCRHHFIGPDCSRCEEGWTGTNCNTSAGTSVKEQTGDCPNECSDQGRCVDGRCVCFPGFIGPDCKDSNCPGNCNDRGRCVSGQCECDPGFSGPDCSQTGCPGSCNHHGRCVDGKCVCDAGFTGPGCLDESCPGNCNNRGRCVNGRCECDPGFKGPDCSEISCPNNCTNRGRCVDGQCECDLGFRGSDCSESSCPDNCNSRGRCLDGKCICDSGFTGATCSDESCSGNCNSRGRCVNGQCICDVGFSGPDCSEKDCPSNCSNRGTCLKGKCVCNVGFAGPKCAVKACLNNCNHKGRCIKGKCVCRHHFIGPDCSRCEEGWTGTNCNTKTSFGSLSGHVMSGVSQLSTSDITETSVTLTWTPPPLQYNTYHLTFTGQKDSDTQINVQVDGGVSSFTQTGLAPGQEYSASIRGEVDSRLGAESSTHFMTLIPGPSNLHVLKTTSTSAVIQWEQSQGEIDRYRLTIVPNGDRGRTQELTIPPHRDSAHIKQLEAGHLYDIVLVAEKGTSQSESVTTQVTPGKSLLRVTIAPVTEHVTPTPGQDHSLTFSTEEQQENRREDWREAESVKVRVGTNKDSSSTIKTRAKPLFSRKDGLTPKVAARPILSRKTNGSLIFNTSRIAPDLSRVGLKTPTGGMKKKAPTVSKKPKSEVPIIKNQIAPLTVRDPSMQSMEKGDHKNQSVISGVDSRTNNSDKSNVSITSEEQPHVGDPVTSESTETVQHNEKCLNKIKVTHIRLSYKDRVSGCSGDENVVVEKTTSNPNPSSSESEEITVTSDVPILKKNPTSEETEPNYTPDPLHQLLTDTFDDLNIKTFSIQLSKPSDLSVDRKTLRRQIVYGLKPLTSFSSSLLSAQSSVAPSLSSDPQASASTPPSPLPLTASSSLPSSSSISEKSHSDESEMPEPNARENTIEPPKQPEDQQPSKNAGVPVFRRNFPKVGYVRRLRQNTGLYQNRTRLLLRAHYRSPLSNTTHGPGTQRIHTSASSAPSGKSPPFDRIVPEGDPSGHKDVATNQTSSGIEQSQNKQPTEGGRLPVSRLPPKAGRLRRPNVETLMSQINPNLKSPLDPETESDKISSNELHTSSLPHSSHKDSSPVEGTVPVQDGSDDIIERYFVTELNQTVKRNRVSSFRPTAPKGGYSRRPNLYVGPFQNRTRTNLRPRPFPHGGPTRKAFPPGKVNGGRSTKFQSSLSQNSNIRKIPFSPSEEQNIESPAEGVQITPSKKQGTLELVPNGHIVGQNTAITQTDQSGQGDNMPIQTNKFLEEGTRDTESASYSGIHKNRSAGAIIQRRPTIQLHSPSSGQGALKPVTLPKRKSSTGRIQGQSGIQRKNNIDGGKGAKDSRRNDVPKTGFESNTEQIGSGASKAPVSSGVTGDLLDYAGEKNLPSEEYKLAGEEKVDALSEQESEKGHKEDSEKEGGEEQEPNKGKNAAENTLPETITTEVVKTRTRTTTKPPAQNDKIFKQVHPGSDQSFSFENVSLQNEHTVTFLGNEHGLQSRLNKLVISTGPEPPSDIVFSEVTENSVKVSWTKPKSPVSGFKVTYTHAENGEPMSMSVDSEDSTLGLSQLSPGSSYEVSVVSILGQDESDPIKDFVTTLPDPPTDLRVINITDGKALLLWHPAMAAIDKYTIVYGTEKGEKGSELRITVSGNAAEQQLSGLEGSTTYTVTISSQLGGLESSPATIHFTTHESGRDPETVRNLQASRVTPRTAMLSWKPPSNPVGSYRLTYQTEGQEMKEVTVEASATEFNLTRLHPGSNYIVQLQAEAGGRYSTATGTEFTTVPDPPTDLRVINITDGKALLLWRPAMAAIDKYTIVYGTEKGEEGSELRITVSGNAAEQQLSGLEGSTTYTVTISSQLGGLESSPATTHFTTHESGRDPETVRDLQASRVTPRTAMLSWKPPSNPVGSYRLTYQTEGQEMKEVAVEASATEFNLTRLHPGSNYIVQLQAEAGGRYSAATGTEFTTVPDPPTDLRVINITDGKALLLWRPAMAAIDKYTIVYGTEKGEEGSELRITVSGNAAEQQLSGLEGSTTYTVTISSQLGGLESSPATIHFTTHGSGRDPETVRDLQASRVTPRTAMLSWKPPSNPVGSYRLTYQTEGQEMKEVTVEASATEFNLTRLHPGSNYIVQLQAEAGGRYSTATGTEFTTGLLRFPFPSDCSQELQNGIVLSDVVEIFPHGKDGVPVKVYCDMETDGGGWMVFQRRKDGSVNFYRGWKEYVKGFGDLKGEFWLGLDSLHNLTSMTRMSLRVDLRNGNESAFAKYSTFRVASGDYRLSVSGYSGTAVISSLSALVTVAGDSFSYHNNRIFTTKDRDPAPFITRCAMSYRGGWWYRNCHETNLNGLYGINIRHQGVIWNSWKGKYFSIPFTEMKMRPRDFRPPARG